MKFKNKIKLKKKENGKENKKKKALFPAFKKKKKKKKEDLGKIKNLSQSTGEQRGRIIVSRSQCVQNIFCEFCRR